MVSIIIFGFLLGVMRFFRVHTGANLLSCVTIIGNPNNEHRNDNIFDNSFAFFTVILSIVLVWLLFDDQFTFGNGYITQHFGLVVPDNSGLGNFGFAPINALGAFAGICLGEAFRNIVHLFEPAVEDETLSNGKRNAAWVTLDPRTQVAAELCAKIYELNERTSRIAMAAISSIYQIRDAQKPAVQNILDQYPIRAKKISSILKPLRMGLGENPTDRTLFFEQIVKIGLASGHANPRYIDSLKMLAKLLNLDAGAVDKIMNANGFTETAGHQSWSQTRDQQQSSQSYHSSGYQRQSHTSRPLNDTEKHLATLGLKKGATQKEIKSAYRKLAKKYHPDLLKSKSLSDAQIAQATQAMRDINAAYEWLED